MPAKRAKTPRAISVSFDFRSRTLTAVMTDGTTRTHTTVRWPAALAVVGSKNSYGGYHLYASFAKRHPYTTRQPDA
jgi:hypothetical protein